MVRRLQSIFFEMSWAAFCRAALIFILYPLWGSRGRGPPVGQRAHGTVNFRKRKTERTHGNCVEMEDERMRKNREAGRTAAREGNLTDRGRESRSNQNGRKKDTSGKLRKFLFPLVILVTALAVILSVCIVKHGGKGKESGTWNGSIRAEARAGETEKNPLSGRKIYFSGMEDAVIGMDGIVRLENSMENGDFLMKYEVYNAEGGELVYESGLIASGESVDWMPGESMGAGEYILTYLQIPCYADGEGNYVSLTWGSCQAWIRIRENRTPE